MDIIKISILIAVLMLPTVASASTILTSEYDIDFSQVEWVGTSFDVDDGDTSYFFMAGKGIPQTGIVVRVIPRYGGTPLAGTTLDYICGDFSTTFVTDLNGTYWLTDGYYVDGQSVFIEGSDTWTSVGGNCSMTASGQNLTVTVYDIPTVQYTEVPSASLESIVQTTSSIIQAGFDILVLMLIITGMLFIFFLVIFTWKIFEYFIRRVRAR